MSKYNGKIKVINADSLCFPVDPYTLEPLICGCYIPNPWSSDDGEVEKISSCEWSTRIIKKRKEKKLLD